MFSALAAQGINIRVGRKAGSKAGYFEKPLNDDAFLAAVTKALAQDLPRDEC
ncbi:MAG: hypothetical protein Q7R35_10610 [Elusimicrobiota bacterium]|nr:hypothetical protein [Elusimicrobiota bacterium]